MDDLQARIRHRNGRSWGIVLLWMMALASSETGHAQTNSDIDLVNPDFDKYRFLSPYQKTPKPPAEKKQLNFDILRQDPEDTQLVLARLALEAGRVDEALEAASQALLMRPGWYDALLQRAEVYTLQGKFAEALADCNRAISMRPDDPRAYLCRIETRVRRKDLKSALREAEKALARWPDNPAALAFRGNLRAETGNESGGLSDFNALLERLPNHLGYRRDRLRIEIQADRPELALRDLDWMLERFPYDARGLELKAESLARLGRFQEADEALGKAIAAAPTNASLFRNRAELRCLRLDRIEDGLRDFEECFALDPDDYEARIERASVYHKQGQYARALADLDHALSIRPVWTLLVYRALIEEESGNLKAALGDLDRAINLDPKAGPAYFARSLIRMKLGDPDNSALDFERFADLGSPDLTEGSGPVESVVRAIRETRQPGLASETDAQVQKTALRPPEARR
jgi:tetratricopeptide (TPR) repeat protein